jgi:hypothetical protein
LGESTAGEIQPFTHVSDASPLVGGAGRGSAGGVGDASDGVDGNGDEVDGSPDGRANGSGPRSQAARRMSSDTTIMRFFMR